MEATNRRRSILGLEHAAGLATLYSNLIRAALRAGTSIKLAMAAPPISAAGVPMFTTQSKAAEPPRSESALGRTGDRF